MLSQLFDSPLLFNPSLSHNMSFNSYNTLAEKGTSMWESHPSNTMLVAYVAMVKNSTELTLDQAEYLLVTFVRYPLEQAARKAAEAKAAATAIHRADVKHAAAEEAYNEAKAAATAIQRADVKHAAAEQVYNEANVRFNNTLVAAKAAAAAADAAADVADMAAEQATKAKAAAEAELSAAQQSAGIVNTAMHRVNHAAKAVEAAEAAAATLAAADAADEAAATNVGGGAKATAAETPIRINIRTLKKSFILEVLPSDKISDVKARLENNRMKNPEFMLDGRLLDDTEVVRDLNIQKCAALILVDRAATNVGGGAKATAASSSVAALSRRFGEQVKFRRRRR